MSLVSGAACGHVVGATRPLSSSKNQQGEWIGDVRVRNECDGTADEEPAYDAHHGP